MRYRVADEDCQLDLAVEDFYPRTDFFPPDAGTLVDDFASSHYETSGRVTGTVVLGGVTYEVDGLGHRDHSWGTRRWDTLLNHRWVPGTFGPDLSFGSIAWHRVDCVDAFCEVLHQGRIGFCVPEVSTNPRGGSGPITTALRASRIDGLSK